jgi:hypothetical protein
MLGMSPCRYSATLVPRRVRGYVERFLTVLPRPFSLEVMPVSEPLCGERCSQGPLRRRKEFRNIGQWLYPSPKRSRDVWPDLVCAPSVQKMQRGLAIYDVAKAAGVAPSTVSRAFCRPGRVNSRNPGRVSAARDMGYHSVACTASPGSAP